MLSYPNLREVYRDDTEWNQCYIFESKPQIRTVKTFLSSKYKTQLNDITVSLPFPYIYFLCSSKLDNFALHIGISNTPVSKPTDKIYFPPLPNIYVNWQVCQEHSSDPIKRFWLTRFGGIQYYSDVVMGEAPPATTYLGGLTLAESVKSLDNWQTMSVDDVLSVKWPFFTTFDEFIDCRNHHISTSAGWSIAFCMANHGYGKGIANRLESKITLIGTIQTDQMACLMLNSKSVAKLGTRFVLILAGIVDD